MKKDNSPKDIEDRSRQELFQELAGLRERVAELEHLKAESKWSLILDSIPSFIAELDLKGIVVSLNKTQPGFTLEDFVGRSIFDFTPQESLDELKSAFSDVVEKGVPVEYEAPNYGPHKTPAFYRHFLAPVKENGKIKSLISVATDITGRKYSEDAVRESEERYRSLLESSEDPIYLISKDLTYLYVNEKVLSRFGLPRDEVIGREYKDFHSLEGTAMFARRVQKLLESGKFVRYEYKSQRDNKYFLRTLNPIFDRDNREIIAVTVISKDITDLKKAEKQTKASLREKEVLLREIHHRVKNNLQIIDSLLALQSEKVEEEQVIEMYRESRNRIRSMSFIHEKLYQSEDLTKIDFRSYIEDLVTDLFQTYPMVGSRIVPEIKVEDVLIGINTAIPCGLIINELVSNSLKHAFPALDESMVEELEKRETGVVKITLNTKDENEIELIISDNGVGLPEDIDFRDTDTLGMHLVTMLAESQLKGRIELDRTDGTKFQIIFREVE